MCNLVHLTEDDTHTHTHTHTEVNRTESLYTFLLTKIPLYASKPSLTSPEPKYVFIFISCIVIQVEKQYGYCPIYAFQVGTLHVHKYLVFVPSRFWVE